MNKYQEALETIDTTWFPIDLIQSGKMTKEEFELLEYYRNAYKLLKELVDRATPKKPIVDDKHFYDDGICPNCHSSRIANWEFNDVFYKHCADCGQALDWSKDE